MARRLPSTPRPKRESPDEKLLDLARRRWKQAQDATTNQRTRELEDIKFYNGDQWPADVLQSRKGGTASVNGMPATPERPCLVINKVQAPVRQVLNEERQSDMGIEIVPADDFGSLDDGIDHTEIELREGLVRRIQRQSNSADAWTWGFARAVIAGTGYVGVMTRYVEGKSFDQEIYFHRFYNQACVSLDPAHEQPDGSDAEWGFVWTDMTYDQYKAEFPYAEDKKNRVCEADGDNAWRALGDEAPDWFTTSKDKDKTRMCRVGDYYYTERDTKVLVQLPDGTTAWKDEMPDTIDTSTFETRRVVQKSIKWCKIDGCQVLDRTDWPGKFIPIIKILGDELQPCDHERRVQGMVRPSRDSQRGFNYMVSKQVETVGLTPIPPLMVEEGTIEGYEKWYEAANTRTLPYLIWKRTNFAGQDSGRPEAVQRQSQIGDISISIREFDAAIKSTTIVPDPTLGEVDPSLKSGKAINAILQQAQRGTSNFLDNLARSMNYGARIVNDLLPAIYGRPGRLARMVTGQGEQEQVLIGQPFVQGPNGRPQPLPEGQSDPKAKTYKLTKDADFNVAVKITRSYDTRREQAAAMLGELIGSAPELMTWFGDLFFKYQDGPGHDEMSERAKLMLAPQIQQSLQTPKDQQIPPQIQQEMAKAQEMIDLLTKELEAKNKAIETDQVKAAQTVELEKAKQAANVQQAETDNATKIRIAEIQANTQFGVAELKAGLDTAKMRLAHIEELLGHQAEAQQIESEHAHDAQQMDENRQQEAQQADADRQLQREEGAAGREHESELTEAQLAAKKDQGAA